MLYRNNRRPARGRYCLGRAPPNRVPRPAATTSAMHEAMAREARPALHACQAGGGVAMCDLLRSQKPMTMSLALNVGALISLLPAVGVSLRRQGRRDGLFVGVLALAVLGPAIWVAAQDEGPWHTGFAMSLWVTIVATMALFLVLTMITRHAWRLAPLLVPYLVVLALAALIWQNAPERPTVGTVPAGWLDAHILFAVATY